MKNTIIVSAIVAVAFVLGLGLLGSAIKNRNQSTQTISVTGLGTKSFTSDLITWEGNFSRTSFELQGAYEQLASDRRIIEQYLLSKGVKTEEMVFSAVDIQKQYNYSSDAQGNSSRSFAGYLLSQKVMIESKEVDKIEAISRNITEIINRGVELTSAPPNYFFTGLSKVKQEMIAEATKDARARAERIAENAGSDLGSLSKATTGVIQITAPNSTEEYSWGGTYNTSSREKEASITIKLEYEIN